MSASVIIRLPNDLISVAEAAALRGVSVDAILNAYHRGSLPGVFLTGKCLMVDREIALTYDNRRANKRRKRNKSR